MQTNLTDLDYFRTVDDIIFLVKGYYHPEGHVIALPVFWGTAKGERIHPSGRRYKKEIDEMYNRKLLRLRIEYKNPGIPRGAAKVPLTDIVEVFHPRDAFLRLLREEKNTIWLELGLAFCELAGVPIKDIGVFGSYLVGLGKNEAGIVKDVDFLIYGQENFCKLRDGGLNLVKKRFSFGDISEEHLAYHAKKYGSYMNTNLNTLEKTLSRKWPSIQISRGVLSTIRFIYEKDEVPENPINSPQKQRIIGLRGTVVDDEGCCFMPRTFKISSDSRIIRVVTYFWALYCPVRKGDEVEITGRIHESLDLITIDDDLSGIKIV